MEDRQRELLLVIVESYIREAEPVGSRAVEGALGVSSATIRNEMSELEEAGFLYQPYTSAGRVPTTKGFQFYIDNIVQPVEPSPNEQRVLKNVIDEFKTDYEQLMKQLARALAELSGEAVVVAFNPHNVYYTGLSQLFNQPEFSEIDMVRAMGAVVDKLEESMSVMYQQSNNAVEVRLGSASPLNEDCAMIFTRYNVPMVDEASLVSFLGPLRMDYGANMGRFEYLRKIL